MIHPAAMLGFGRREMTKTSCNTGNGMMILEAGNIARLFGRRKPKFEKPEEPHPWVIG